MAWKIIALIFTLLIFFFLVSNKKRTDVSMENVFNSCIDSSYYENGLLILQGRFCDGLKNGNFIEYYSNGKLKWQGIYKNNLRVYRSDFQPKIVKIDTSKYIVNQFYFKLKYNGIHPKDYYIICHGLSKIKYSDDEEFDFIIKPDSIKSDTTVLLNVYFTKDTSDLYICDLKVNLK